MPALKGFGHGGEGELADRQRGSLNLDWGYGWSADCPGTGFGTPGNEDFVPMILRKKDIAQKLATVRKELPKTRATHLLGYNEPDLVGQANMTVASALYHWPKLEATGLRLGAPATIKPDAKWLDQFLTQAERKGLRVDFLPIHIYGWPNADDFLGKVAEAHEKYQLPIWVTEYAVADFKASTKRPNRYTREQVRTFMTETVAGMRAMPFVERFAWKTRATADRKMGTSALFHADGTLTSVGRLYASL